MEELHKLENYNYEIIKSFIDNAIEESAHIEFKSAGALSKKDADKKEVSKDVSAFANSDGGIIIYGISEKNHKADSFSFIDGDIYSKEWLEQIISSTIKRNILNLKIFPIREGNDINKSVYVVQIPSSIDAPHMSRDKRFYKRGQFESILMEEYEVRGLYGRTVKSKLKIVGQKFYKSLKKSEEDNSIRFTCLVLIKNIGEKLEKEYKIAISIINSPSGITNIMYDRFAQKINYTINSKGHAIISSKGYVPIYPDEEITPIEFEIVIKKTEIEKVLKGLKMKFHLLYSNGEDSYVKENFDREYKKYLND